MAWARRMTTTTRRGNEDGATRRYNIRRMQERHYSRRTTGTAMTVDKRVKNREKKRERERERERKGERERDTHTERERERDCQYVEERGIQQTQEVHNTHTHTQRERERIKGRQSVRVWY